MVTRKIWDLVSISPRQITINIDYYPSVQSGENKYRITATKNKFQIQQLEGLATGEMVEIIFAEDSTPEPANRFQFPVK